MNGDWEEDKRKIEGLNNGKQQGRRKRGWEEKEDGDGECIYKLTNWYN